LTHFGVQAGETALKVDAASSFVLFLLHHLTTSTCAIFTLKLCQNSFYFSFFNLAVLLLELSSWTDGLFEW
jgi:hypothetical protein